MRTPGTHRLLTILMLMTALALGLSACDRTGGGDEESGDAPSAEEPERSDGDAAESSEAGAGAGASGSDAAGAEGDADPNAGVVARVNGEDILLEEFRRQVFDAQRYATDQGTIDPNTEEGQQQLLYLRRLVLNDMIDQLLVEQASDELGIVVTDADVAQRVAQEIDQNGGEAAFDETLEKTGSTREEFDAMVRSSLVGMKMLDEISADVPETAEFVRARHILCDTAEDCERALQRLESGEPFTELALELSTDATTRERGGDLDWISRGTLLSAALEDTIFALDTGERSGVVQTDLGYHVIELVERDPERELGEAQRMQLKERRLLEWLSVRRSNSDIEIFVEDLQDIVDGEAQDG